VGVTSDNIWNEESWLIEIYSQASNIFVNQKKSTK